MEGIFLEQAQLCQLLVKKWVIMSYHTTLHFTKNVW
jgi:hypothetical protein